MFLDRLQAGRALLPRHGQSRTMPEPRRRAPFMSYRPTPALLAFSDVAFGAKTVASEVVDAAFGMPSGKLRQRAGIVSLSYAEAGETEVTLAIRAASGALTRSGAGAEAVDWILAVSETHQAFPSLA